MLGFYYLHHQSWVRQMLILILLFFYRELIWIGHTITKECDVIVVGPDLGRRRHSFDFDLLRKLGEIHRTTCLLREYGIVWTKGNHLDLARSTTSTQLRVMCSAVG